MEAIKIQPEGTSNPEENPRVQKLQSELHRCYAKIEGLETELEFMLRSPSWKVTEPLRTLRARVSSLGNYWSLRSHQLCLTPTADLAHRDGMHVVTGRSPSYHCGSSKERLPIGWCTFRLICPDEQTPRQWMLYIDSGAGFVENNALLIDFGTSDTVLVELPRLVRTLRLDPLLSQKHAESELCFSFDGFRVREQFRLPVYIRRFVERFHSLRFDGISLAQFLTSNLHALFRTGFLGWKQFVLGSAFTEREKAKLYSRRVKREKKLLERELQHFPARIQALSSKPLISIILPTYNTPSRWLNGCIRSVLDQCYQNWELCIADDASTRPNVQQELKRWEREDARIRVLYRAKNGHISASSNSALSMAQGEYTLLLDHDDLIPPDALLRVVEEINKYPHAEIIYSDEDRITELNERIEPYLKPSQPLSLLLSQNVISHLGVYKTELLREISGFREGYEGSQDWDLALRAAALVKSEEAILHIPEVLYHWRWLRGAVSHETETQIEAYTAGRRSVEDFCRNRFPGTRVSQRGSRIEVTLPFPKDLREVLVIGSVSDEVVAQCAEAGVFLRCKSASSIRHEDLEDAFQSVSHFLFLAPGVRPQTAQALLSMLQNFSRPNIGIIGGKLMQESGRTLAGAYTLGGVPFCRTLFRGLLPEETGYRWRACTPAQVLAVNFCCALVSKEAIAEELWGDLLKNEERRVPLGIEASLLARERGYGTLYLPQAEFVCENETVARLSSKEERYLRSRWREKYSSDPYYGTGFTPYGEPFGYA